MRILVLGWTLGLHVVDVVYEFYYPGTVTSDCGLEHVCRP